MADNPIAGFQLPRRIARPAARSGRSEEAEVETEPINRAAPSQAPWTWTASPTNWIIASGHQVSVGDLVALELGPDCYGEIVGVDPRGLPKVRITEGPQVGQKRSVRPNQITSKRLRRPSDGPNVTRSVLPTVPERHCC